MSKRLTVNQKFVFFAKRQRIGDVQKLAEILDVTPACISRITNFEDPINAKTANAMYKLAYSRELNYVKIGKLATKLDHSDYIPSWQLEKAKAVTAKRSAKRRSKTTTATSKNTYRVPVTYATTKTQSKKDATRSIKIDELLTKAYGKLPNKVKSEVKKTKSKKQKFADSDFGKALLQMRSSK